MWEIYCIVYCDLSSCVTNIAVHVKSNRSKFVYFYEIDSIAVVHFIVFLFIQFASILKQ